MPRPKANKYPECAKLGAVHDQLQIIRGFMEWLSSEKRLGLAGYDEYDRLQWATKNTDQLLMEFYDIDPKKLEEERRAMLEECRRANT